MLATKTEKKKKRQSDKNLSIHVPFHFLTYNRETKWLKN